ncbi:DUF6468 domain-containing protein [uncultured Enterovirga sp.]|uniref:DUF6468 domain-containing protein n=1 Tax=uncultured Enterovirga sp. TaxID=2026352 RepID=UPI0035C971B2
MSPVLSFAADLLVAILLVATILTSVRLSGRMKRLKADESAMRATIGELLVATDSAERAIAGLRATVSDCDRTLGERLSAAAHHSSRLAEQVTAGETVISRVVQIAELSRKLEAREPQPAPAAEPAPRPSGRQDLKATMEAARLVAARAAHRMQDRAA